MNKAKNGDVVEVGGGTYLEALATKASGVTITGSLQAGHNAAVTIKGANAQTVLTVAHQTTWRRLTFDASANTDAGYYVVRINGGHPTFDQCVIGPGQRLLSVGSGGADFIRTMIRDARRNAFGGAVYVNAGASGATTFAYSLIADTGYGYIQIASGKQVDFNNCLFAGFGGGVLYVGSGVSIAGGVHWKNCLALSNGMKGNPIIENDATATTVSVDHCLVQPMAPYYLTSPKYVGKVVETTPLAGSPALHRGRRLALVNLGIDDATNVGLWSQVATECDLYGFKTTFALNTASAVADDWTTMQAHVTKGHEVASHTAHHVYLPERRLFDIRYNGTEAATLTVDRQAMTLSVTVTGNTAASFSLPLSPTGAYPTVAKIQQYISAKPNFTCTLYTVAGTSYNSGSWLSQDMGAVAGTSLKGQTVTVSVDAAAANQDELAAPKAAIEQHLFSGGSPYVCDTLVYPYLHSDASVQAAAVTAGYAGARGSADDSFAMGSPDGYNVMQIWATQPGEIFGRGLDEATLRLRVSAVLEFAKFTGAAISLYSHGEDAYTLDEWRGLIRLLAEDPDVQVVTLRELVRQVSQNAASHAGTTYYRTTWPDIANYVPEPHSPLVEAGAAYATAVTDFGGMTLAAGDLPSVGLYEWPRTGMVNADAGQNQTMTNATSGTLVGKESLSPATIASYAWTQVGGPTATLSNASSSTAGFSITGLNGPRPPVALTFKLAITGIDGTADYDYQRVSLALQDSLPSAVVLGLPASPTNQTSVTLTVGGANVTTYQYRLDGDNWSGVIPVATPIVLTVLSGTHSLDVVGGDASGNWQLKTAPTTLNWTVDTVAPSSVTLSGQPPDQSNADSASISVSGADVTQYIYSLDGGAWSTPQTSGTPIALSGLAQGSHTLSIRGGDGAGNWQTTATVYTWTVDTTAPASVTLSGLPTTQSNTDAASISVGGADVTQYIYSLDSGAWSTPTAVGTLITLSGLSQGSHALSIRGGDGAGNWQVTPTVYTWTVDTVAPSSVTLSGQPPSQSTADSASITVGGTDVTQYVYSLDSGAWSSPTAVGTPIALSGLPQGSHTLSIRGGDGAGNWQTTATVYTWTVGAVATNIYYVDPNGSGGDGHTWATALRTVQAALNKATSPGDVVEISGGVYNEVLTTVASGVTITGSLQAGHNAAVTIKGANAQTVLTVAHQTTWRRLTFDASANTDAGYYVVRINGGHPTFDQCVIGPGQRLLNVGSGGADFTRTIIRDARRNAYGGAVYINAGTAGATTFRYSLIADTGYGYIQVASGKQVDFENCLFAGFGGGVLYVGSGVSIAGGVHWKNCLALSNGMKGNPIIENDATATTVSMDHCLVQPMAPYYLTSPKYVGNVVETTPLAGSPALHRGRRLALVNLGIDDATNVELWSQVATECDLYGFKTTFALNTASAVADDWTTMQAHVTKGHEVASHTAHHVYLPERRLFDIRYNGTEAATLTVDRQAMTLSVTVTGNAAASFSLPLSPTGAYPTVAKIQQYISAKPNFTCTLYTVAGTSYNSGSWLSQDMGAVAGASIKGQTVTVSVDETAANQDELAAPKAAIEQHLFSGGSPYVCDTLVYPYLHSDASVQTAAVAAGYAGARGSADDSFAMGSPDGYNVMQIWATQPGEIFGRGLDEATLRPRVSAVLEFAKFTGAAISLFSHGEGEYTLDEWRGLIRLLAEDPDVQVVTLRELVRQVSQNAASHAGTTYYRTTWPDIANYVPEPHSPLVEAGAAYTTAVTDFGGMTLTEGDLSSVGLYEWPRTGMVNADAGQNQTLTNATSGTLVGKESLSPATIASYAWTQVGGPTATLSGASSSTAGFSITGLIGPRPPVALTFKLAITGIDGTADYDYQRVSLALQDSLPSAVVLGLPASPTNQTSVTLTVGGANVTVYQYRLDGDNWSGVIPVATPIVLTVLSGTHSLDVVGGDASGNWQLKTAPTTLNWTVSPRVP